MERSFSTKLLRKFIGDLKGATAENDIQDLFQFVTQDLKGGGRQVKAEMAVREQLEGQAPDRENTVIMDAVTWDAVQMSRHKFTP